VPRSERAQIDHHAMDKRRGNSDQPHKSLGKIPPGRFRPASSSANDRATTFHVTHLMRRPEGGLLSSTEDCYLKHLVEILYLQTDINESDCHGYSWVPSERNNIILERTKFANGRISEVAESYY
jgi:hypothetical protein